MVDLRFASALQVMLSIAHAGAEGIAVLSSSQLAEGLEANPSFVRKLVGQLADAGLVTTINGKHGGMRLSRPAAEITLADVYLAVSPDKMLIAKRPAIAHRCLVTANINSLLDNVARQAQEALLDTLRRRDLATTLYEFAHQGSTSSR